MIDEHIWQYSTLHSYLCQVMRNGLCGHINGFEEYRVGFHLAQEEVRNLLSWDLPSHIQWSLAGARLRYDHRYGRQKISQRPR